MFKNHKTQVRLGTYTQRKLNLSQKFNSIFTVKTIQTQIFFHM
uniref:Uncharacterized protein n=1 Tax=Anguilla anguilla TaxID=7936 RepID=A0A0E9SE10_ANGAN